MKRFLFILSVFSFLFLSCSSDSFEPLTEDIFLSQLSGEWVAAEIVTTGCEEESKNGSITCNLDDCLILTIDPEGTYTLIDNFEFPSVTERGSISAGEETVLFCPSNDADCRDSNYILSGETLTLSYKDPETECNSIVVFTRQ